MLENHLYIGGVLPQGSAVFYSPSMEEIEQSEISLRILNSAKIIDNKIDYHTIGLEWNSTIYKMASADFMLISIIEFIKSGSSIAYTVPNSYPDREFLLENSLSKTKFGKLMYANEFVFAKFDTKAQVEFLHDLDVNSKVESLPLKVQTQIAQSIGLLTVSEVDYNSTTSYANTDMGIMYQVYFENQPDYVTNVSGNPLRYHFNTLTGSLCDVKNLEFPSSLYETNDQLFIFYQSTAILRQLFRTNPMEVNRFYEELKNLTD